MQNILDTILSTDWVEIHSVVKNSVFMYRITAYGNRVFYGNWMVDAINDSTLNEHDKNWIRSYFGFSKI